MQHEIQVYREILSNSRSNAACRGIHIVYIQENNLSTLWILAALQKLISCFYYALFIFTLALCKNGKAVLFMNCTSLNVQYFTKLKAFTMSRVDCAISYCNHLLKDHCREISENIWVSQKINFPNLLCRQIEVR